MQALPTPQGRPGRLSPADNPFPCKKPCSSAARARLQLNIRCIPFLTEPGWMMSAIIHVVGAGNSDGVLPETAGGLPRGAAGSREPLHAAPARGVGGGTVMANFRSGPGVQDPDDPDGRGALPVSDHPPERLGIANHDPDSEDPEGHPGPGA